MKNLIIVAALLFPLGACAQTHPSIILTPSTLAALSTKVVANDETWVTLKAKCDQFLPGTVYPPDHVGASPPNISQGYLMGDYKTYVMDFGLCYQALKQTDPTAALPYGNKVVALILAASDPSHQLVPGVLNADVIEQNSSYGIRMAVPALALGYDWVYDLLTASQKAQVYTAINKWCDFWRLGPYPVVVSDGAIISVNVNDHGIHFATQPTANIHNSTGVPGSGAVLANPVLDANGDIVSIAVTSGGTGYSASNPPEVYINGVSRTTFEAFHPESNYYMGYYLAECLAALATQGENPEAAALWNDWYTRVHGGGVGPWEGTYLKGGGWTEGFMNYGPLSVQSAEITTLAVNDVKGIDLTAAGFTWPVDTVDYMIYDSWPSQWALMDEGSGYCRSPGCGSNVNGEANMQHPDVYRWLAWYGKYWSHPHAAMIHKFAKEVFTATASHYPSLVLNNMMPFHDAEDFLYWFPNDPDADYTTLPLSYKASGIQEIFARSNWTTNALWLMIHNSPYIESSAQGEQEFGTGELEIVNGSTPFIVLPMGWSMHLPDGDAGKRHGICDEIGGCAADPAHNTLTGRARRWYNTFQVATWDHSQTDLNQWAGFNAIPPLPPGRALNPLTTLVGGSQVGGTNNTTISAFEDNSTYLFSTALHLESMMRQWVPVATSPISTWTRQEVYLRPSNQILVYDRTTVLQTNNWDQVVAWHTPALPSVVAQSPTVPGTTRNDVTYNSSFAGSIISLLPANAAVTSWDLDNGSTVWRTEIRNATCTATSCSTPAPTTQQWLTALDANTSSSAVYNTSNINSVGMTGALLKSPQGNANYIVLFNTGAPGTTVSGAQSYTIPIGVASTHVLTELASNTQYSVSYNSRTGGVTVQPGAAGTFPITTTTAGVLSFLINPSGTILKANADTVRPPAPTNVQVVVY
jgi:hypothetical protein